MPMGIVKLVPHGKAGGELNRVNVRDAARGLGCGKAPIGAPVDRTRAQGYPFVYLNSLRRMTDAHDLYENLGFQFITPDQGVAMDDEGVVRVQLDLGGMQA